jgi:hypothetical protein
MAARAAMGIRFRLSASLAALSYLGVYFWSQADSYQHHYLVGLLLLVGSFLPEKGEEGEGGHWAIPLIYVQLALLYFWTAVTKCDPTWLSGATMNQLTGEPEVRAFVGTVAARFDTGLTEVFAFSAWATMLGEYFACLAFLIPRLRLLGLITVPWFHVGVEVLGFDIELFSYYMVALDLILLSPDRFWTWIGARTWPCPQWASRSITGSRRTTLVLTVSVACTVVGWQLPFDSASYIGSAVGLVLLWPLLRGQLPYTPAIGAGNLLLALAMVGVVHISDSAYDFYRMWGGDLRRRGQPEAAMVRYESANALKVGLPARRLQLARLYEGAGRMDEANVLVRETYDIYENVVSEHARATYKDPTDYDAFLALAEDNLRLADRCTAMARSVERDGNSGAEYISRRTSAFADAEDAAAKALALRPQDQRDARKVQNRLRKARRKVQ